MEMYGIIFVILIATFIAGHVGFSIGHYLTKDAELGAVIWGAMFAVVFGIITFVSLCLYFFDFSLS